MKVISNYKTTLSASMTSSQNTVPVTSVETSDGHTIVATDFDNVAYLVIEPGSATMEIVKVTGLAGSSFTGVVRGLAFYGGTETAVPANQFAHQSGSTVIMTNAHYYYDKLVDLDSIETITGKKTFSGGADFTGPVSDFTNIPTTSTTTPTTDNQIATKKYVDDTAIAGAAKATDTVYGISKLSSAASVPTAPVVLNSEEVSATSGANKVVRANASGKIDPTFLNGTENYIWNGNNTFNGVINFNHTIPVVAGENITVTGTLPVPVYIKASDGLLYRSNAAAITSALFDGFITNSVLTSGTANVIIDGIVGGFSGLTIGTYYYISDTVGTITATATSSTYTNLIGKAVTTSSIKIDRSLKLFNETIAIGTGARTATVTATKPWKYAYIQMSGGSGSGTVLGGQFYVDKVAVTSASAFLTDSSNMSASVSGNNIGIDAGAADKTITGGNVYFYGN